jgi:methyl-accepting chemotaxis protein
MKFIHSISIKQRILLTVLTVMVCLFAAIAIIQGTSYRKQWQREIEEQARIVLLGLEHSVILADKHSSTGFSPSDYFDLKPLFNQSIYSSTGFPLLIDYSGTILIHIHREGQRFPRDIMADMHESQTEVGKVILAENHSRARGAVQIYFKQIEPYNAFVAFEVDESKVEKSFWVLFFRMMLLATLSGSLISMALLFALKPLMGALRSIGQSLSLLAWGENASKIKYSCNDEVGHIASSLNQHIDGIERTAHFAAAIGKGNLDEDYTTLGENDMLGASLLNMRLSLKSAIEEEEKRKQEDQQRSWFNSGLAQFSDILRQNNNDLQKLSDIVIQSMVNYLDANQGGLFILNDEDPKEPFLELLSAFAYNRKKLMRKVIKPGEGLVGNCILEKQTLFVKEIPDDYLEITSGLGDASPNTILIVPLKLEDKMFGVIEVASFNEFAPHEIEFVEKIGESIASALSSVKTTIRTNQLLEQSQQQGEEMAAQEEEMRQNMEEMLATQEEMARKNIEMEALSQAINESFVYSELSTSGYFNFSNPNFLKMLECRKEDLDGKVIEDFISENDRPIFRSAWTKILDGTPFQGVFMFIPTGSNEVFVQCSMSAAYDASGNFQKIFFIGQDVTDSKQIEIKAIKQAEEIESTLIELQMEHDVAAERENDLEALLKAFESMCMLVQTTNNGSIGYANTMTSEILGMVNEDIVGNKFQELLSHILLTPNEFASSWEQVQEGEKQSLEVNIGAMGKTLALSLTMVPIADSDGYINRIICIGTDITQFRGEL